MYTSTFLKGFAELRPTGHMKCAHLPFHNNSTLRDTNSAFSLVKLYISTWAFSAGNSEVDLVTMQHCHYFETPFLTILQY